MGMNVIPLKELTPNEPKELTLKLLKTLEPDNPENEKPRGELVVEVMYKPFTEDELPKNTEDTNGVDKAPEGTPATGGLLVIIIHEAEEVEGKHHTNPYARLIFKGEERKTKVSYYHIYLPSNSYYIVYGDYDLSISDLSLSIGIIELSPIF
jgi:hypothetical protein